ncbi:uncharacterized protein LOC114530418 [Dendronephthya gigantea]|uniref:uncharacterized protein LOC114530418 n=1 Tax=Dendronephthya gigantea TaxID=151771 RepID=UPI00106B7D7B|nr:uncharacterized protein LOC114530418 [Dendronephthya gigantea]
MSDVSEQDKEGETVELIDRREKRSRIPTQKGFQNALVKKTAVFNKQTKLLQQAIASVYTSIEKGEKLITLERAVTSLEINKQTFESGYRNLERLITEDRWNESAEMKDVVRETKEKYIRYADSALRQAAELLSTAEKFDVASKGPRLSEDSRILKSSRVSSHASSTSARMKAMADVAAAREEAEYDVLMAEKEAEAEWNREAARAQHNRDMVVLEAKKKKAIAEAKLEAIEQSISDVRSSMSKTEIVAQSEASVTSRTKSWISQQKDNVQLETKRREAHKTEKPPPAYKLQKEASKLDTDTQIQENRTDNSGPILHEGMRAVATTNEKLAANIARMSLPKCQPDLFAGDVTMFHPWKGAFNSMLRGANVTAEQEMNYLYMFTRGGSQRLVNSFRKRQYSNMSKLLKELWLELENRYGNTAIITNAFLVQLRESAKFGEQEKKKLQAFSDLCLDVASQIDQLPGLGCLNYPTAMRPILNVLPERICHSWEKKVVEFAKCHNNAYPQFEVFANTVEKQSQLCNHPNVTALADSLQRDKNMAGKQHYKVLKGDMGQAQESTNKKRCIFHDIDGHNLLECKTFARKTLQEKTDWLKRAGLCFRCLTQKHDCKTEVNCTKCGSNRHLGILHMEKKIMKEEEKEEVKSACTDISPTSIEGVSCSKIVLLDVFHPKTPQNIVKVYALIDEQSNASLIAPKLVDDLGLEGPKEKYCLTTCSSSKETHYGRRVSGLTITSSDGVLMKLPTLVECDNIPSDKREIPIPEQVKRYGHLREVADKLPPLNSEAEVQLLIGRDAPEIMKVREVRNGPKGAPWAHRLAVGWTVCGRMCVNRQGGPIHITTHRTVVRDLSNKLEDGVQVHSQTKVNHPYQTLYTEYLSCPNKLEVKDCYDEPEDVVFQTTVRDNEPSLSIEDRRFLTLMDEAIHKNEKGNWEMPLPLRNLDVKFPNNRKQAESRMNNLLQSFKRKPKMEKDYLEFMEKLLERGHAVPVPSIDSTNEVTNPEKVWYLPHLGVYHPRKPGKIRVVFDSSAEFQGSSLNKELLSGPDILNNPLGILIRFRLNHVAVVCDIEQMFHNFYVSPTHRNLLRFLWFEGNDKTKIIEYHMTVHLFGNTSSPSVAMFGLRKTADDGEEKFGQVVKEFVKNDFYVDDGLTSCSTSKEAIDLIKNSQSMLATANLRLHKIASNSTQVMEAIPLEDQAESLRDLDLYCDPLPSQLSLGIVWNLQKDTISFRISLPEKPFTRRGVLAVINSIYDPLGLVIPWDGPSSVAPSTLIQSICPARDDFASS